MPIGKKQLANHAELIEEADLRPWAVNRVTEADLVANSNMLARTIIQTNPLPYTYGASLLDDEQLPDLRPATPHLSLRPFNVNQMAKHFSQAAVIKRLEAEGVFERLHDQVEQLEQQDRAAAPQDEAEAGESEEEGEGHDEQAILRFLGPETLESEGGLDGDADILHLDEGDEELDLTAFESEGIDDPTTAAEEEPALMDMSTQQLALPRSPVKKLRPPADPCQIPSVRYTRPHSSYARLRGLPERPSSAVSRRPGSATAKSRARALLNRPVSASADGRSSRPALPPAEPAKLSRNQLVLAEAQAAVLAAQAAQAAQAAEAAEQKRAAIEAAVQAQTAAAAGAADHPEAEQDGRAQATATSSASERPTTTATSTKPTGIGLARPATPSERAVNVAQLCQPPQRGACTVAKQMGIPPSPVAGSKSTFKRGVEQRHRDARYAPEGSWSKERMLARRKRRGRDVKPPRPQPGLDPNKMFEQQRAAIKESKRVNTIDHTWDLLNFPMTSQQARRNRTSNLTEGYQHDQFYQRESRLAKELHPENFPKADAMKKWANEASRMGWDMYK